MRCPLPLRLPLFLFALAMPIAGCAGNDAPHHVEATISSQTSPPSSVETSSGDCDSIPSLIDKRACYGRQDQDLIDECERTHPMRCKPYREMHIAARELVQVEQSSVDSATKAYATYADGDPAYLKDLEAAASQSNRAWQAYREAQCALEPFAQGMSRDLAEDLAEACRVRMTRTRIIELRALYAPARMEGEQP